MQRRTVDPSELDENMTEETKRFVTGFLSSTDPRAILHADLNIVRHMRNESSKLTNGSVVIENVAEKEFHVKSHIDGYEIPVTAYIPEGAVPTDPIVVFFHGGGWTFCSRVTHHHSVASIAQHSKCIWLSVEYRLSPEFKHPVGLDDCLSVTKWTLENKGSFLNADESALIGVSGDSAGGHYAATIAHELKAQIGFQILVYPCVHLAITTDSWQKYSRDCYILIPDVVKFFAANLINSIEEAETDPRLSPLIFPDFTALPKCLIVSAELDPIVDHSHLYRDKLVSNDNKCEMHIIKGVHHGFFNAPGLMPNAFAETRAHIVNYLHRIRNNEI